MFCPFTRKWLSLTLNLITMKTTILSLIAVFLFGMIATGFLQKPETTHQILLQSTNHQISSVVLSQSAAIIQRRLSNFSIEKSEVSVIPGKILIKIILGDKWDLKFAEKLVTQKGSLTFYETYFYKELDELLAGDTTLFSLLHAQPPSDSSVRMVCTTEAGTKPITKYLSKIESDQKCKFAWSDLFNDSNCCLFALKTDNGNGVVLRGSDIESFKLGHDTIGKYDYLKFECKREAIQLWADITKHNINRSIAMLMDNKVIYSPMVYSEIPGGKSTISGNFSLAQLKFIESIGNSGELPAVFEVVK